jgi:hypothetical protein
MTTLEENRKLRKDIAAIHAQIEHVNNGLAKDWKELGVRPTQEEVDEMPEPPQDILKGDIPPPDLPIDRLDGKQGEQGKDEEEQKPKSPSKSKKKDEEDEKPDKGKTGKSKDKSEDDKKESGEDGDEEPDESDGDEKDAGDDDSKGKKKPDKGAGKDKSDKDDGDESGEDAGEGEKSSGKKPDGGDEDEAGEPGKDDGTGDKSGEDEKGAGDEDGEDDGLSDDDDGDQKGGHTTDTGGDSLDKIIDDIEGAVVDHTGVLPEDIDTELQTGAWLPPAPYWESAYQQLSRAMVQALGRLAPQEIKRQLGGNLDMGGALTFERGNMRIWKRNQPDLRPEAGLHVIITVDWTPSMAVADMETSIPESGFVSAVKVFAPAGVDIPLTMSHISRGGKQVLGVPGYQTSQIGQQILDAGNVYIDDEAYTEWKRQGLQSISTYIGTLFVGRYVARLGASIPKPGKKKSSKQSVQISRIHAACGLAFAVGQALEDTNSAVEFSFFGLARRQFGSDEYVVIPHLDVPKQTDRPMDGRMYYALDGTRTSFGTGPGQPPWDAVKRFEQSDIPGRMFITISDGGFSRGIEEYIAGVDKLNQMGVITVFLWIGRDPSFEAIALAAAVSPDGRRTSWHHDSVSGRYVETPSTNAGALREVALHHRVIIQGDTPEDLLNQIPVMLTDLQRELIEAALRKAGFA